MNIRVLVVSMLSLAVVGPALAVSPNPKPVTVISKMIQAQHVGGELYQPGQLSVEFVNNRAVPATMVDFNLTANGQTLADIQCLGTFSQGITIRKTFPTQFTQSHQVLKLASVLYEDGSVWMAGSVIPKARRQAVTWRYTPLVLSVH